MKPLNLEELQPMLELHVMLCLKTIDDVVVNFNFSAAGIS